MALGRGAVLQDGAEGEIRRLFLPQEHRRLDLPLVPVRQQRRQLVQQRRRVPPHGGVHLAKGVKGDLPRDEGREAHDVVQQKFVRRGVALPLGQQRRPVLFRQPVRVLLPRLGVRQMVEHPRQQGPGLGQVALHPAQAVHDAVLPVQEQQVRPSAHHL